MSSQFLNDILSARMVKRGIDPTQHMKSYMGKSENSNKYYKGFDAHSISALSQLAGSNRSRLDEGVATRNLNREKTRAEIGKMGKDHYQSIQVPTFGMDKLGQSVQTGTSLRSFNKFTGKYDEQEQKPERMSFTGVDPGLAKETVDFIGQKYGEDPEGAKLAWSRMSIENNPLYKNSVKHQRGVDIGGNEQSGSSFFDRIGAYAQAGKNIYRSLVRTPSLIARTNNKSKAKISPWLDKPVGKKTKNKPDKIQTKSF